VLLACWKRQSGALMPISGNRNRPDRQLPVHSLRGDRRGLGAPSAAYFGQGIGVRFFFRLLGTWFSGVVVSTLMRGEKRSFRMSAFFGVEWRAFGRP